MSYTPINWQTGDTITAEKMNKMDNGWSVDTSSSTLFTETVTTSLDPDYPDDPAWGDFSYSQVVTADTLTITFNGTPYECAAMFDGGSTYYYGGWVEDGSDHIPDFSEYPFAYTSEPGYNAIATENAGTYTVKIDASTTTLETSTDFQNAVKSCVDTSTMPMLCVSGTTTLQEMQNAAANRRLLYCYPFPNSTSMCIVAGFGSNHITLIPTDTASASFVDGVFTITV